MSEWKPGQHQLFVLHTRLASFQLFDQGVDQERRHWGCQPAEYYVDALEGRRARYDALPDASSIRIRMVFDAEEIELPEFSEEAHTCYVCPSPAGRWIHAPSGQLTLSGGVGEMHELRFPPGAYRLLWFVRVDVCPFILPRPIPAHLAADQNLAEQLVVLRPMSEGEPRPHEELIPEQLVYSDWYRIQQEQDPRRLARLIDEPDELGYRRLVVLYRLGQLDHPEARAVLEEIRQRTTQTILAIVAREILSGNQTVSGPETLEGLPPPAES